MHFLITGHTGFKGSWLTVVLTQLNHEVSGFSLNPAPSSLYQTANLQNMLKYDGRGDIRDNAQFSRFVAKTKPDVAIHMAAQALVRQSYADPINTFTTNVEGTLSFLRATERRNEIRGRLVVTSDKVYRNDGRSHGYIESDALGGRDPYSASKSMADILTQSWQASNKGVPTGIARAGNVIGGGDRAEHRLVPDLIKALQGGAQVNLRYPYATRPWQHVLDCLSGYLTSVRSLLRFETDEVWNIGPDGETVASVQEFARHLSIALGAKSLFTIRSEEQAHEEHRLHLNSRKIRDSLDWFDALTFDESVGWTAEWEEAYLKGANPRELTDRQVSAFLTRKHPPFDF